MAPPLILHLYMSYGGNPIEIPIDPANEATISQQIRNAWNTGTPCAIQDTSAADGWINSAHVAFFYIG